MLILDHSVSKEELVELSTGFFSDMIKGVVDIEKGLLAIDAELHADLEQFLLDNGSKQECLWGINLYPDMDDEDFLEFDSLINIRPMQGNRSRGVEDPVIQERVREVVETWVKV